MSIGRKSAQDLPRIYAILAIGDLKRALVDQRDILKATVGRNPFDIAIEGHHDGFFLSL